MDKISSQQVQSLLKTASVTIRSLEADNASLREKLAGKEKQDRIEKIAGWMEEKGLHSDLDHTEKVSHLQQVQNLDVTEEAVKLASPQTGILGNLSDSPGAGVHAFEHFITTGEAPG